MKIYIAGKITGNDNFVNQFKEAEEKLRKQGHTTVNPATMPSGFKPEQYMSVCVPMLTMCDAIYLLKGWETSGGAKIEKSLAEYTGKLIVFDGEDVNEKAELSLGIC
jgi:hypothetical protein